MLFNGLKNVSSTAVNILFSAFIFFNTLYFILKNPLKMYFAGNSITYSMLFTLSIFACTAIILFLFKRYSWAIRFSNYKIGILILVLITAIPRLIWINIVSVNPLADFHTYHIFAEAISKGSIIGGGYIALFPHYIGYPVILAPFYMLFGAAPTVAHILNVVLSCGISILLYLIGSKLFDKKSGFTGALIWSLWPSQIFYTSLVATEIIFTFMMLLCIYLFIKILEWKKGVISTILMFLLFGVLCSVTNVIRPLGLIVLAAVCIYYLIFVTENIKVKSSRIAKTVFLASLALGYLMTSQVVTMATSKAIDTDAAKYPFGFNIYVGSNYDSNGTWNQEDSILLTEISKKPGIAPQQVHNELLSLAMKRIKERSPYETAIFLAKKHGMIWPVDHDSLLYIKAGLNDQNTSIFDFLKFERFLIKLSNFYYHTVLLLCGFLSIILIRRKKQDLSLLLVIIVLGIITLHFIVEVAGRYHFPSISLFSLLAGYGLLSFSGQVNHNRNIAD